ncbi:hypothetical protein EG329_006584 [Mollisiaceae sp. DMI_Dod_QoI]|nr:hypothetical protein EG329_006584 [Helotiales sp. DMI_Dod_QoI]
MEPHLSLASPVATHGQVCDRHFDELCALFDDEEREFIYEISRLQVSDSYGQFKVWAGNIGALQSIQSASSLDYRLREVPKVSKQVVALLQDLDEALEDVIAIASGERENRVSSPVPVDANLRTDDEDDSGEIVTEPSELASRPVSEIQEIFQSIPETIASLFKLSILIRNSSSRDRFAKALSAASKAPFNDQFDIDHVGNKFPCLYPEDREWLRKRLGKAITQKRQYLRYCREHREKLSKVPEARDATEAMLEPKMSFTFLAAQGQQSKLADDAQTVISRPTSTLAPTTASTVIPADLESAESLAKMDEQDEDDTRSQTSYATSIGDDDRYNRLSVVRLEEVAGTAQSFECPYCWTIQRISNQQAWRKHVMRDLKPYTCDQFNKHVRRMHADKFTEDQLPALIKVCQKPVDKLRPSACPFCDEWETKLRELNVHMSPDEILVVTTEQFRHHVGSHMEQLALFAIPRGYKEDGDAGSSRAAPGHGSDGSSDRSLVKPDYEDEDNPRLHVAAFEGLFDEVKVLLDNVDLNINSIQEIRMKEGTLAAAAAGGHLDIAELCRPREEQPMDTAAGSINRLPRSKSKGWGPLHWAASNGHLAMTHFLIAQGVSVLDKAFDGSTAADLARRHGHDEVEVFLERQEELERQHPKLVNKAQPQDLKDNLRIHVIAADGLYKRDSFSFPDPFAIVTIGGEQTKTTTVVKKTLNPYWNEAFDFLVAEHSIVSVQIFDNRKFKKKDESFLGVISFRVGDIIELESKSVVHGKVILNLSTNLDASLPAPPSTAAAGGLSSVAVRVTQSLLSAQPDTTSNPSKKAVLAPFKDEQGHLPAGWERREDNLGRTYYVDHYTRTTSWNRPTPSTPSPAAVPSTETTTRVFSPPDLGELPPGWETRQTPEGRSYFVDHNTQQTTWVDPRRKTFSRIPLSNPEGSSSSANPS